MSQNEPPNAQQQQEVLVTPELQVILNGMVEKALNTQGRNMLQSMLNPVGETSINVDQVIEDRFRNDTSGLDRIPDVVRCLKDFSGNQIEFSSWKKNVERILNIYESAIGTPKYFGILSVIRNKIVGDADVVLESYNTPLNWRAIAKCLTLHYADKRDISTLEYQLTTLVQGNNSVEEFYKNVYSHLSLILNKVSCLDSGSEAISLLTLNYRNKALDTFIRGLNGNLSQLLAVREPADLPQALNLCLKLENQNFRSFHANNAFKNTQRPPALPPKRFGNKNQQQQPFYPQLAYIPQDFSRNPQVNNQNFIRRYGNGGFQRFQQPFGATQLQTQQRQAEPMDVDESIQTRRVDYMNRPRYGGYREKRPASSNISNPNKQQRNFHLNPQQQVSLGNIQNIPCNTNSGEIINDSNSELDFSDLHHLRLTDSSLPYFEINTGNGKMLRILVDTGSNENYIRPELVKNPCLNAHKFFVFSIAGKVEVSQFKLLSLFKNEEKLKFYLLPTLKSFDAILGNNSLKNLKAVIYANESYMLLNGNLKINLKQHKIQAVNKITIKDEKLNKEQKNILENIVKNFENLFLEPNEKLPYTTKVVAKIRTLTNEPVYTKSYPYPMGLRKEVERQIQELIENDIIRPSRSPYNSPVHIVPKKCDSNGNKQYRMVIDYRKLNSITIADKYPIPDISEILANLGSAKIFTVLDLKSGFHQIPLQKNDIEKTAFSISNGKFEFKRLPFGLKNAPAIFQRALDDILREHLGKCCYIYMDDIIIFSAEQAAHVNHIEQIFKTLCDANMKVQLDKCQFFKDKVEFLGFVITPDGIKSCPSKIQAIANFKQPETLKELRSFLGLSGFYRRFIRDYAKLAKPLTALLRGENGNVSRHASKNKRILFNDEATSAFERLKNTLVSREVLLYYPDFNKTFDLTTDASNYAIGAVLSQDGRPISFISRTLSKAEENYACNEKEMLAIVWSLSCFRNYLYGSAKVHIYTDHQPLTYALSHKNNNAKMKRWKAALEEYSHSIFYKPGSANVVADALSRLPIENVVNSMTATQHTAQSSSQGLIYHISSPINVFRNQLILIVAKENSYNFRIVFPKYHRHLISQQDYSEDELVNILRKYLNPSVINGIKAPEHVMGKIQNIFPIYFENMRIRFTNLMVEDIRNEEQQEEIIITTHNRAHRNAKENKLQILQNFYFPGMARQITRIVRSCKVCAENKYDRNPNKPKLFDTPIPEFPGHTVHIDIFITEKNLVLTALDKYSKFAQVKILKGKSVEDIRQPLRELLFYFCVPRVVVMDNEKALNSESILFMMTGDLGIDVFTTPPYRSEVNGQVERFHSTLVEIMRCLKKDGRHRNFEELLERSVNEYNFTFHSTINQRPVDVFFGRNVNCTPEDCEKARQSNIQKLLDKQAKDIHYHNKKREEVKQYDIGEKIFVRLNKRLGSKLSPRFKEETVKENRHTTVIAESGRVIHKSLIRNTGDQPT